MVSAATRLLQELQARYVYTESDEISVLLPADTQMFDREVEKLVSLSASIAASAFSIACGEFAPFDSRVWVGARRSDVIDYFRWRQSDATRCALNGWCYWTLRNEAKTAREATAALLRASVSAKHELLFARGINFNDVPAWQRRGTGIYFGDASREGIDPRNGNRTRVVRRRVVVDEELPMKAEYSRYVRERTGVGVVTDIDA
jgi:tRNA(His) 5'-end guanylyltransferase